MTLFNVLLTIAEFAVGGFIIWGLFNEEKLVRFERRLAARIARRFGRKCAARPCSYNVIVGNGNCNKIA
ncbi:MAG: hypothetical protein J6I80_03620 [Clostridia bacterium]|nr:hypothetical protein [Clostridia bacterium]